MLFTSSLLIDLLISVIGLIAVIYLYISRNYNYWKQRGVPYIEPLPFCGSLPEVFTFKKSIGVAFRDIHHKMKDPFIGIFVLDKPYLIIKDCNLIKTVLIEGFGHFMDRNVVTKGHHDTVGSNMLVFMPSPDWANFRKKMTPIYTTGKIKAMFCLFEEVGNGLVNYLAEKSEISDVINFKEVSARYTVQLITSTAFGLNSNSFSENPNDFFNKGSKILDYSSIRRAFAVSCYMFLPSIVDLLRLMLIDPDLASFFRYAFWKTFKQREDTRSKRNDLIDILIQMKKDGILEDDDKDGEKILAQAVVFFIGGYETSSITISFALYELAKNPKVQCKLRAEIQDIIESHGHFSYDLLNNESSKYLTMVVKETLRKYPVIPYIDRKCNKDFPIPGTDKVIEKGVGIYVSALGLQMDPENFPNPEDFIPERFSEDNISKIKPYTYMPFGEGPRSCLGTRFGLLGVKHAIASIILNFEVEFCQDTPRIMEFNRMAPTLATSDYKLFLKYNKLKRT